MKNGCESNPCQNKDKKSLSPVQKRNRKPPIIGGRNRLGNHLDHFCCMDILAIIGRNRNSTWTTGKAHKMPLIDWRLEETANRGSIEALLFLLEIVLHKKDYKT